jgi:hypothetical protein
MGNKIGKAFYTLKDTYMMAINTKFPDIVLSIGAGVQSGEERNGSNLVLIRLTMMLKMTVVSFNARTAETMVVAKHVIALSFFDLVKHAFVDGNDGV